jgi:uncharacterized protein YbjT (DUF2867 family)
VILVTGATGKIGRHVVAQLLDAGVAVRALARDPAKASLPDEVTVVRGDLSDPPSLASSLADADAVFLLWAVGSDETAPEVIDAIARHASRVVYLSSMGIPDDPAAELSPILSSHRRLERLIEGSGLDWTFVRAGGLASNTLGWAADIRADGVVREAFGGVPRALVHERDVAMIAARALTEDGHQGRRYEVTGPEIVTGDQQVQAIADAIGRPLRMEALSRDAARARLVAITGDAATADSMLDAWARMVASPEPPTTTFEQVIGRRGSTFREWARDHKEDFSR